MQKNEEIIQQQPQIELNSNSLPSQISEVPIQEERQQIIVTDPQAQKLPSKPPKWIPDDTSDKCMKCLTFFGFFNRRHHCRNCGGLFCNQCCGSRCTLAHIGYQQPERTCQTCITYFKFKVV